MVISTNYALKFLRKPRPSSGGREAPRVFPLCAMWMPLLWNGLSTKSFGYFCPLKWGLLCQVLCQKGVLSRLKFSEHFRGACASHCGRHNVILKTAQWTEVIHMFSRRKLRVRESHNLPKVSITAWWAFHLPLTAVKSASAAHGGWKHRHSKGARFRASVCIGPSFCVKRGCYHSRAMTPSEWVLISHRAIYWTHPFPLHRNELPLGKWTRYYKSNSFIWS